VIVEPGAASDWRLILALTNIRILPR